MGFLSKGAALAGAVGGGGVAYIAIGFVGHFYEMNFARSGNDLSNAYAIYLLI